MTSIPTTAASSRAELFRALATLVEEPAPEHARLAELLGLSGAPEPGEYTDLFLMNLYPYASVHLGSEGMMGGEARDRVAGFWSALGMLPPAEPDHLVTLLGLFAELIERESEETEDAARLLLGRARGALLREHLLPWLPPYLARVEEFGGEYFAGWAKLLAEALREEAARADALPTDDERAGQRMMPLHLRDVPALPDPRGLGDGMAGSPAGRGAGEGMAQADEPSPASDFLTALLAPARSGMIITRRDLSRAGSELGLGVRKGERAYILKALLGQDPAGTLKWLAAEAGRWAERHRAMRGFDEAITEFWESRAAMTASLLGELAGATPSTSPAGAGEDPSTGTAGETDHE